VLYFSIILYIFYILSNKIGWEYHHWIDITLTNLMEVVIFKIYLTIFVDFLFFVFVKTALFVVCFNQKNVQKGPTASKLIFCKSGVGNLKIGKSGWGI